MTVYVSVVTGFAYTVFVDVPVYAMVAAASVYSPVVGDQVVFVGAEYTIFICQFVNVPVPMASSSVTRIFQSPLGVEYKLFQLAVVGNGEGNNWNPVVALSALYVEVNGAPEAGIAGFESSEVIRVCKVCT